MSGLTAMASSVGAGVSQIRSQNYVSTPQLKEQSGAKEDVRAVALQLIRQALKVSASEGHDLDVLA